MNRSPRQILGVPPDATLEQCKRVMRRIVFETHPDRFPNDPVREARCKEVIGAWSVLTGQWSAPTREPEPDWAQAPPMSTALARPWAQAPAPRIRSLAPSREYMSDQAELEEYYGQLGYWKRDGKLHISLAEILQWIDQS